MPVNITLKARRFVVATGSSPFVPPIPGLDEVDYFTNENIFDNSRKLGPSDCRWRRSYRHGIGPAYLRLGSM